MLGSLGVEEGFEVGGESRLPAAKGIEQVRDFHPRPG